MKSKKAFIKLNGEVGEKENPAIEYTDNDYLKNQQKQIEDFKVILSKMNAKKETDSAVNQPDHDGIL
jgi:hypothetical protein